MTDLPGDTPLLMLWAPDPSRFEHIVATSFRSEADAREFAYHGEWTPRLLPPGAPSWSGSWLTLTKDDLAALPLAEEPWVHLRIKFGETGSHWALVHWNDEDAGFELHLATRDLYGLDVCVALFGFGFDPPLCLVASHVPENPERVFIVGDGDSSKKFRYDKQVGTYLLAREVSDELWWDTDDSDHELMCLGNLGETLPFDDGTIATLVKRLVEYHDGGAENHDRVTYTRLFPPGYDGSIDWSRDFGHWYPVFRTGSDTDPVTEARGDQAVERGLGYLRWVGAHARGRVREVVIVSHAVVAGPSHVGEPATSPGDLESWDATVLDAIAQDGVFWVTGCNADGGTFPDDRAERRDVSRELRRVKSELRGDELGAEEREALEDEKDRLSARYDMLGIVHRQALASVEGTIRAYLRLTVGVSDVLGCLAGPDIEAARTRAIEVFGVHPEHPEQQRWQLPGSDEGALIQLNPAYGERHGPRIAALGGLSDREATILGFGQGERSPAEAQEALAWIRDNVTWERVLELTVADRTVGQWLERARRVLSSELHYVAAFARMAAQAGRGDIRAYGGLPGQDGQHLVVKLDPDDEKERVISAYLRNPVWSRSNPPWLILFYRRFGFPADDPLWYLDYSGGRLDAQGQVAAAFDHTSLEPWPPPVASIEPA